MTQCMCSRAQATTLLDSNKATVACLPELHGTPPSNCLLLLAIIGRRGKLKQIGRRDVLPGEFFLRLYFSRIPSYKLFLCS
ncbi:hypothetical protein BS78_05G248700 [Paspalum vaginatum]|nr:hypothetical protein BS78_05G248700 [Paspalum vaginatum]KAJ1276864.1 hypothetical protein BS78_05G248700 [Paspalum vaginatum]